jgi:hypothetical protein
MTKGSDDTDRHSEPVQTPQHQPLTPEERAPIEAENGLRQFDRLVQLLEQHLDEADRAGGSKPLVVKHSVLIELARLAVERIIANPGGYRQTPMTIRKKSGVVKHEPPRWEDVPQLVDEMCDHVNQHWHQSGIHLAAYLLWRVNWIHPFSDGNGRTARAIAYLVLCAKLRQRLPGDRTIPDFISDNKAPYYAGLEAADEAWSKGELDVSALEDYLGKLLADQVTRAASASEEPPAQVPPAPTQKREIDLMAEALGVARSAVDVASKKKETHTSAWIGSAAAIVAALIGAFAIWRCNAEPRARCVPSEQKACLCPGGVQGIQVCAKDGLTFGDCTCPNSAAPSIDAGATFNAAAGIGDATSAPPIIDAAID